MVTYHEELPPPAPHETLLSAAFGQVPVAAVTKETAVLSAKLPPAAVAQALKVATVPAAKAVAANRTVSKPAEAVAPKRPVEVAPTTTLLPKVVVATTSAAATTAKVVTVTTQKVTPTTVAPPVVTTAKAKEKVFRLSLFPSQEDDAKQPTLLPSSDVSSSVVDGFMQSLLR